MISMSGPFSFLLLAILAVTGLILFPFYPLDFARAYTALAEEGGLSLVGLMRSVHRGSAELFILFVTAHAIRAFILRKYGMGRWTPFAFGAALVAFALWQGVTGYILPMDIRSQALLSVFTPLIDMFFGAEGIRAFSPGNETSEGTMLILLAAHLVPPFFAVAALAGHTARLSETRVWPKNITIVALLVGLAVAYAIAPATSLTQADFSKTPGAVAFDWLQLFPAELFVSTPGPVFWSVTIALLTLLGIIPYLLTRKEKRNAVNIHEDACVGCGLCAKDCPYKAMSMAPRPHESRWPWVVTVETEKCIDCGVCVGSCGFHALDITRRSVGAIRAEAQSCAGRVVAYVCGNIAKENAGGEALAIPGVIIVSVACGGQVYPGWIDDDLRNGATGVIVAVCAPFSCSGRLGSSHTAERIGHERRPFLRKRVDRNKVGFVWIQPGDSEGLQLALAVFADELRSGGARSAVAGARLTRLNLAQAVLIAVSTALLIPAMDFLWKRTTYALEDPSTSKIVVTYDTHDQSGVKIFFDGKLALEKTYSRPGSIDPAKIAVTAQITGGAAEARIEVVEGVSAHSKSIPLPPGRIVALWKNPETGAFELR